ncbi:hypothetical protein BDW22DRAFT_1363186 [Trametopsis cervina]|nr:hypothetical protein BDW22DRAFT_1363186 [Trametopsis cervina]
MLSPGISRYRTLLILYLFRPSALTLIYARRGRPADEFDGVSSNHEAVSDASKASVNPHETETHPADRYALRA